MLGRICKSSLDSLGGVVLVESSNRACYDTLTAVYAGCLSKRQFERTADVCSKASVVSADNSDTLILLAGSNASSAKDALVIVSYYGW